MLTRSFSVLALAVATAACFARAETSPAVPAGAALQAEAFPGTDIGSKINAALQALDAKPGVVKVSQSGEIRATLNVGVGQTVEFGPGEWQCLASPCIIVDSASQVLGAGVYLSKLVLGPKANGPMVQSRNYPALVGKPEAELLKIAHKLKGDRKILPGVKYVRLRQLTLDGNSTSQAQFANGIELFGYWYWLEDLSIEHFSGNGLVTEFVASGAVDKLGNDANESYFINVKLISNRKSGWVNRGPHDSIVTGMIAANNGEWGIDVIHKEGYHSGAGLMLANTHLYGNGGGLRTNRGANIFASTFESEANHGSGLLLRSNDNNIQGLFYANGKHGIELGDEAEYAAANTLSVQVHNNRLSQVRWANSAGYNFVQGAVFAMPGQAFFVGTPTLTDLVLLAGNLNPTADAQQHFPGGLKISADGVVAGGKQAPKAAEGPVVIAGNGSVVIDASRGSAFWVELEGAVGESRVINGRVGQTLTVIVGQGRKGGATFVWPKDFENGPVVEQAPGRATVATRVFDGSSWSVPR